MFTRLTVRALSPKDLKNASQVYFYFVNAQAQDRNSTEDQDQDICLVVDQYN